MVAQGLSLQGSVSEIVHQLEDSRQRLLELIEGLKAKELMGPRLKIVNPMLWEIGHVAWFQEYWISRNLDRAPSLRKDADDLYDSIFIPHDARWDLPLPSLEETLAYMQGVLARSIQRLQDRAPKAKEAYFYYLSIYHEDMHAEALTYTRQTLGYPAPRPRHDRPTPALTIEPDFKLRDVYVPGGTFMLGAEPGEARFVFDNEKWAHPMEVTPFWIANTPVTTRQFLEFVEDGGYRRREFWTDEGWAWRQQAGAERPVYWQPATGGRWFRRHFDQLVPLKPYLPVIHVNWYEANAYCSWAGRRLPAEVEWEMAASAEPGPEGRGVNGRKRLFPWGNEPPTLERGNLDSLHLGPMDVRALPAGDSAFGCRQMIGNVWEWTSATFGPYPGFVPDPYKEYSQPWFWTHKVLRGGAWTTRSRLIRNTWRNFYTPDRRDVLAGFRTCAL